MGTNERTSALLELLSQLNILILLPLSLSLKWDLEKASDKPEAEIINSYTHLFLLKGAFKKKITVRSV